MRQIWPGTAITAIAPPPWWPLMLAIGRALVGNPRLLLLDEPSDGLAPNWAAEVMAVLDRGKVSFEAAVPGPARSVLEDLLLPV